MVTEAEPIHAFSEENDIDFKVLSDPALAVVYSFVFPTKEVPAQKELIRYENTAIGIQSGSVVLEIQPGQKLLIWNDKWFNLFDSIKPLMGYSIDIIAFFNQLNAFFKKSNGNACEFLENTTPSVNNEYDIDLPIRLEIFGQQLLLSNEMWLKLCDLIEFLCMNGVIDTSLGQSNLDQLVENADEAKNDTREIINISDSQIIEITSSAISPNDSLLGFLSNLSLGLSSISLWESLITPAELDAALLTLYQEQTKNA